MAPMPVSADLPEFHPLTVLRDWSKQSPGAAFRLSDAQTGIVCFGATGSGKTSSMKHFALGYLAHGFGGIVLCSKKDELPTWEAWAEEAGRWNREQQRGDLVIFDVSAKWRFNFLDYEASRSGEGGGLTINIVALLDEIAGALAGDAGKAEGGGDNQFFRDALHHLNSNLVDLPIFAGLPVSLPLMRAILNTAPQSLSEARSDEWKRGGGECAAILREADEKTARENEDARADFEECRAYWTQEFPNLSDRTRSIITLSFSVMIRPLITRPLRRLFCTDSNITPEDTFKGKIIVVALPVQEFRLAGRLANLAWKYCFQQAVLRRTQPGDGSYLRPVFLWADEAQMHVTEFDAEYQAVARSAGGCTVYLVQNRESLLRVLKSASAVDSLLGNLQCKCLCQNSSIETNEWAAKLLGERWRQVTSITSGGSNSLAFGARTTNTGATSSEQKRFYKEPSYFTTLKRGGPKNAYEVQMLIYNGGTEFEGFDEDGNQALLPYTVMTFNQRDQKKGPSEKDGPRIVPRNP
jgi:hypothetical protein